jgi:hypothetical protein
VPIAKAEAPTGRAFVFQDEAASSAVEDEAEREAGLLAALRAAAPTERAERKADRANMVT